MPILKQQLLKAQVKNLTMAKQILTNQVAALRNNSISKVRLNDILNPNRKEKHGSGNVGNHSIDNIIVGPKPRLCSPHLQ